MDNNPYFTNKLNLGERTRKLHDSTTKKDEESMKAGFHGYKSYPEMDKEYDTLLQNKTKKSKSGIINLTNEELKKEYTIKNNYLKNRIRLLFFLFILFIINSIMEYKYFKPADINSVLIILSLLNAGLCFILLININANALIDSFGYQAFYFFAIVEAIAFFLLFVLKLYNFIYVFNQLYSSTICRNKIKCPKFASSLFLFIFILVIIVCQLFFTKFIWNLFLESIRIIMKKEKTFFERQLELNLIEKREKNNKIEFAEEEKLDSNRDNSKDNIKTD